MPFARVLFSGAQKVEPCSWYRSGPEKKRLRFGATGNINTPKEDLKKETGLPTATGWYNMFFLPTT